MNVQSRRDKHDGETIIKTDKKRTEHTRGAQSHTTPSRRGDSALRNHRKRKTLSEARRPRFQNTQGEMKRSHRLTKRTGIFSGGWRVRAPAFRPLRIFRTRSSVQPSSAESISTRWCRSRVDMTETNSTIANLRPEHARDPSENGRKDPRAGFKMPWWPVKDGEGDIGIAANGPGEAERDKLR